PDWSFGFWISRWGYRNREEVMAVARRMREERVPCDVIHIDPYWMRFHEGHHGDFVWDESAFPDPGGMIDELKGLGFRVSLWESPYVPLDSQMRIEGESRGFLMKSKSGGSLALVHGFAKPSAAIDFTNPDAVEWFKAKNRQLLEMGIAVIKTDFAEDLPDDAVAHDGTPAEELHNLYPLLYQRAVFETTMEVHDYGLIWGRSGYAGSQRTPVHWGGDPACTFEDMAASLRGAPSCATGCFPTCTARRGARPMGLHWCGRSSTTTRRIQPRITWMMSTSSVQTCSSHQCSSREARATSIFPMVAGTTTGVTGVSMV